MATGNQYGIPDSRPINPGGNSRGLLRVITNEELQQQESDEAERTAALNEETAVEHSLASYIRSRMVDMRNFRNAEGISDRLLNALRTYRGQYDQTTLTLIQEFGGSEVYARVTSTKCRAATALLRDV